MKFLRTALLCSVAFVPAGAYAGGWYGGGSLGAGINAFNSDNIFTNPQLCVTDASYTCNSNPLGAFGEVFIGNQITPSFGIEAGLGYLQSLDISYSQPLSSGTFKQNSLMVSLSGVYKFETGNQAFTPFVKGGAVYWSSAITYDRTPNSATFVDQTVKATGFSPMVGVGAEFGGHGNMRYRAGVNYIFGLGKSASLMDVAPATVATGKAGTAVVYVGAVVEF